MPSSAPPYRRLPGRSHNLLHWDSLWSADDHLLAVRSHLNGDAYRRFFFRDIEAVVVRRTRTRLWINVVLLGFSALGLFPLLFLLSPYAPDRALAFLAVGAVVPLVLVMVNTARGPTCDVRFQTAVQTERVAALGRVDAARAALALVRPLIWQAQQGELAAQAAAAPSNPAPAAGSENPAAP